MKTNRMVPPLTLADEPVPIERLAGYAPHRIGGGGVRTSTPAGRKAALVLASGSRATLRTARPFEHPVSPGRRVG